MPGSTDVRGATATKLAPLSINSWLRPAHWPRRAYTEALIDWTRGRTQSSEVFIAGDFNFELKAVNETNLYTDNVKHDSESYSHILGNFRDLGREAGDTAINDRRIDYIFGPAELRQVGRVEVLRNAAVGRMDHWPLLVEVSF